MHVPVPVPNLPVVTLQKKSKSRFSKLRKSKRFLKKSVAHYATGNDSFSDSGRSSASGRSVKSAGQLSLSSSNSSNSRRNQLLLSRPISPFRRPHSASWSSNESAANKVVFRPSTWNAQRAAVAAARALSPVPVTPPRSPLASVNFRKVPTSFRTPQTRKRRSQSISPKGEGKQRLFGSPSPGVRSLPVAVKVGTKLRGKSTKATGWSSDSSVASGGSNKSASWSKLAKSKSSQVKRKR